MVYFSEELSYGLLLFAANCEEESETVMEHGLLLCQYSHYNV